MIIFASKKDTQHYASM